MSENFATRFLRDSWWLILALAVVAASAIWYVFAPKEQEPETIATTGPAPVVRGGAPELPDFQDMREEEARKRIESYEEDIQENPEHEDTPALLNAAGNLYKTKLRDYEAAAEKYQLLLIDYPEYESNRQVYFDLETCLRELNDNAGLTWLYELILEREPAESNEVEYARVQLGLISEEEPGPSANSVRPMRKQLSKPKLKPPGRKRTQGIQVKIRTQA